MTHNTSQLYKVRVYVPLARGNVYQVHTPGNTNSDNQSLRKVMDVNEHDRLSNITLRHKLKSMRKRVVIAVLHFTAAGVGVERTVGVSFRSGTKNMCVGEVLKTVEPLKVIWLQSTLYTP